MRGVLGLDPRWLNAAGRRSGSGRPHGALPAALPAWHGPAVRRFRRVAERAPPAPRRRPGHARSTATARRVWTSRAVAVPAAAIQPGAAPAGAPQPAPRPRAGMRSCLRARATRDRRGKAVVRSLASQPIARTRRCQHRGRPERRGRRTPRDLRHRHPRQRQGRRRDLRPRRHRRRPRGLQHRRLPRRQKPRQDRPPSCRGARRAHRPTVAAPPSPVEDSGAVAAGGPCPPAGSAGCPAIRPPAHPAGP